MGKEATDREAAAEQVAVAAETHAEQIATAFATKFKPYAPKKKEVPDVGVLLQILAKALRAQAADLVDKSAKHDAEMADDEAPRAARDAATTALVGACVSLRSICESAYGRAGLKALGIDGRTPTDSKAILDHARKVVKQLKDKDVKLPPAEDGVTIDRAVWAAKLEKWIPALKQARDDVAREEKEADATLNAKNKAMATFDDLFSVVAGFTSSMLYVVDEDDLADRVKPSPRRRGATAAQDTPPDPQDPPK